MRPENPHESPGPYTRCGAKKRNGEPCQGAAMPNGRCRLHGGKTPTGPALPQFKHGRYSKCFKDLALGQRYEECLANGELGELRDEIALVDVMTSRILENSLTDTLSPRVPGC